MLISAFTNSAAMLNHFDFNFFIIKPVNAIAFLTIDRAFQAKVCVKGTFNRTLERIKVLWNDYILYACTQLIDTLRSSDWCSASTIPCTVRDNFCFIIYFFSLETSLSHPWPLCVDRYPLRMLPIEGIKLLHEFSYKLFADRFLVTCF